MVGLGGMQFVGFVVGIPIIRLEICGINGILQFSILQNARDVLNLKMLQALFIEFTQIFCLFFVYLCLEMNHAEKSYQTWFLSVYGYCKSRSEDGRKLALVQWMFAK